MIKISDYSFHRELPKSSLIRIRRCYVKQWFYCGHTVRIANARELYWLGFNVVFRMPWLKHSAKQLYPEIFK